MRLLTIILVINFLNENIHGVLFRASNQTSYAPLSLGELWRGPLLAALVIHAVLTIQYSWNRISVCILISSLVLVSLQGLAFGFTYGEFVTTLLKLVRWFTMFFMIAFVSIYSERTDIEFGQLIDRIKWIIIIFCCVPILLAVTGISGYDTYSNLGDRKGYAGFVMNQNVIAGLLVMTLPFYLMLRRKRDYIMLGICLSAGVLLGSKLTIGGFALVIGIYILPKLLRPTIRSLIWFAIPVRREVLYIVPLAFVGGIIFLLSPFSLKIASIFTGLVNFYGWHLAGGTGRAYNFIDATSSDRSFGVGRFFAWAIQPENTFRLLIGGGSPTQIKLYTEVDWVDLSALAGLLGLMVFYGLLAYLTLRIWRRRSQPYGVQTFYMWLLALGISVTSGHTFDGPVLGIILGIILGVLLRTNRKSVASDPVTPAKEWTESGDLSLNQLPTR